MEESSLKFIADENISPHIVAILNRLGDNTIKSIQRAPFNSMLGTPDEEWLPIVTKRGFICVTFDRQMLVNNAIMPILQSMGARVVFLGRHLAHTNRWDLALWFLRYWPRIRNHAATMSPGDLIRVLKNGVITPVTLECSRPRKKINHRKLS